MRQEDKIQALTAGLKKQAAQIEKVRAQIEMKERTAQIVDNELYARGGSASPENASPARTDGTRIAEGATISGGKAASFWQRVEDNAFHLLKITRVGCRR
jgi:hypothetical protein